MCFDRNQAFIILVVLSEMKKDKYQDVLSSLLKDKTTRCCCSRDSTTDKVPVFCKCKDKRSWCSKSKACFLQSRGEMWQLRIMEEMEIASLTVQILHLLTCIRNRDYGLGMEMTKENPVRGSVENRQEERKR